MLTRRRRNPAERGLTFIELMVAMAVLVVLAQALVPLYTWNEKRLKEAQLKVALETMRNAIDLYNDYFQKGLITQDDVEQFGYPADLEEMVEGVELAELDPTSLETKTIQFLYEIPVDPFTGEREWGLRSYQDDFDSDNWGGENVWDVYSLSNLMALDGTYYNEW